MPFAINKTFVNNRFGKNSVLGPFNAFGMFGPAPFKVFGNALVKSKMGPYYGEGILHLSFGQEFNSGYAIQAKAKVDPYKQCFGGGVF